VPEFLYQLKLVDRLVDESTWTDADREIVERHFQHLQELLKDGVLILAGRTLNDGPGRFGIVILRADAEADARRIMKKDPAVAEKIMSARLYPYRVALMEKRDG